MFRYCPGAVSYTHLDVYKRQLLGGVSGGVASVAWGAGDAVGPRSQELVMTVVKDPDRKRALVLRLKRVEGQLRGIQRQIDEDEDLSLIHI